MLAMPGIHSLLPVLYVLCAHVFESVDQDPAGAAVREIGQKQIQLDKDRTLQAKSPTELKLAQQQKEQDQSMSHQDVCVCVCAVY